MSNPALDARRLYARSYQGVLSTLSLEHPGYPFGSVVTFAPDASGVPVILISSIAEHTRNADADARVSLTLTQGGDDVQAEGRITLVADAQRVPPADETDLAARYFRRFPHARNYRRAHDFSFYRLLPRRVRYIGGFGRIHWLETAEVCTPSPFSASEEGGMTAHMNDDHADAIRAYCRLAGASVNGETPELAAIDGEGFDIRLGKRLLRMDFDQPVSTPKDVRLAMVALVKRAREAGAMA